MTTKFILIGGFLGAGKTTLIGKLAQRYLDEGKTVGVITNDQAADLVDTHSLRSLGLEVGEVAGACFCCSFDQLVATASRLGANGMPDILIAEPVGSCTDLVATVLLPLQNLLGDRFDLAPFGVLLKPSHGSRILGDHEKRSGFSPQAEYIFRKQIEEADYVMIGRADQLTHQQADDLRNQLAIAAPGVPVLLVSPKTSEGIDEVLGYIESPMVAGARVLQIDYDTYAEGEAELGWVNLSASLLPTATVGLDALAKGIAENIRDKIVESEDSGSESFAIAHVKVSAMLDPNGQHSGLSSHHAVANVISNDAPVDVGLFSGQGADSPVQIIVNARVAMPPDELESVCRHALREVAKHHAATIGQQTAHSLRPGRPVPTHRVQR